MVRWPRGHLPGSKNKPMSSYILEVAGGNDVVEAILKFCRRKNTGLCVLTTSGTVANVMLRQPSTTPGATITFHGHFDMLSVSATFLTASFPPIPNGFTISLTGLQRQIVRGLIARALIAVETVYVVAASFNNHGSRVWYSRWGLGGKGEKMGFGDVEKMMLNLLPWKSSLV